MMSFILRTVALCSLALAACVAPDDAAEQINEMQPEAESVLVDGVLNAEEALVDEQDPTELELGAASTARISDCQAGWMCLWEHANYEGRRLQFSGSGCQNLGGVHGFNDKLSSVFNRSGARFRIYQHAWCQGSYFDAAPGQQYPHLHGWNDEASSIRRL